jgi:hypothetical protein
MAAGITLLAARDAAATGTGTAARAASATRWYVETVGTACEGERTTLEREIKLACDALGGTCGVAPGANDTDLRAVLDCSGLDDSWTLVTRTIDGTVLASVELDGAYPDRLRHAAVEVAREAAPERSLAIETLRDSLAAEKPAQPVTSASRLSLLVGGRVSSTAGRGPETLGGHLLAGLTLARSFQGTLGFTVETGGNSSDNAMRSVAVGAGVAAGAPFDRSAPIGFAAEGGMANVSRYAPAPSTVSDGSSGGDLPTLSVLSGYAQGTFYVQWPGLGVRPFAAIAGSAHSEGPHIVGTAEAGVTFALF